MYMYIELKLCGYDYMRLYMITSVNGSVWLVCSCIWVCVIRCMNNIYMLGIHAVWYDFMPVCMCKCDIGLYMSYIHNINASLCDNICKN